MRRPGIEPTCAICDVELYDDPHWHDGLELFCCADCCPNEGCLQFSPTTGPSLTTRPDSAPVTTAPIRSAAVPAVGELHA